MADNTDNTKAKEKTKILTVRLGAEEADMIETLKGSPYFINVSNFMRESIRRYYDSRVNKAGRVKDS